VSEADTMPRPRPRYLHRDVSRHGKTRWYVHTPGQPRVRLTAAFGTAEFFTQYEAAISGELRSPRAKAAPGSLAWLIARYKESSAWRGLSLATQRQRDNIYKHVVESDGDQPLAGFQRRHILAGRERRASTPHQANNFLKSMRAVWDFALDAEIATTNPTKGVPLLNPKSDGYHVWTEAEVAKFEARWPIGTRERLALDVLLYTGLRRGDAVTLGRQHVRNSWFRIRTEKNGVLVEAPLLPVLATSIEATPTGDLTFIAGERGGPRKKEAFGTWFRLACIEAGVPGRAHGLRKAGATRAAEHGASEHELMAIFGWTDAKMARVYTKQARRAKMAGAAMSRLDRGEK
jgi:integrase